MLRGTAARGSLCPIAPLLRSYPPRAVIPTRRRTPTPAERLSRRPKQPTVPTRRHQNRRHEIHPRDRPLPLEPQPSRLAPRLEAQRSPRLFPPRKALTAPARSPPWPRLLAPRRGIALATVRPPDGHPQPRLERTDSTQPCTPASRPPVAIDTRVAAAASAEPKLGAGRDISLCHHRGPESPVGFAPAIPGPKLLPPRDEPPTRPTPPARPHDSECAPFTAAIPSKASPAAPPSAPGRPVSAQRLHRLNSSHPAGPHPRQLPGTTRAIPCTHLLPPERVIFGSAEMNSPTLPPDTHPAARALPQRLHRPRPE